MQNINLYQAEHMQPGFLRSQVYNALDCIGTRQVYDALHKAADASTLRTYGFIRATQAVGFTMSSRGILVDQATRATVVKDLQKDIDNAEKSLATNERILKTWDGSEKETGTCPSSKRKDSKHTWAKGVPDGPDRLCDCCGTSRFKRKPFEASSPTQVMHLLYDLLHLPVQTNKTHKPSSDHDCLDKLRIKCPKYVDILEPLLAYKGLERQIQFLTVPLRNGRYTSNFSIGTAYTGRWSSQKDNFGYGGNAQNVSEQHRHVFIADPGFELCYADLKQAECLTGDHEVLTPEGWVRLDCLPAGLAVASWNTGVMSWEQPTKYHQYAKQRVRKVQSKKLSFIATDNHRVPYYSSDGNVKEKTVAELKKWEDIPVNGILEGGETLPTLTAQLAAAFHADGSFQGKTTANFRFKRLHKIERLRNLLEGSMYRWKEFPADARGVVRFSVHDNPDFIHWGKRLDWFVLKWDLSARQAYLHEMEFWDGHKPTPAHINSFTFSTAKDSEADVLGALAHISGWVASNRRAPNTTPNTFLNQVSLNRNGSTSCMNTAEVSFAGTQDVFCLTVPSSFFMIRHAGRISITGNSNIVAHLAGDEEYIEAHRCLPDDAEVLTPEGWVSISQTPDVIAGWCQDGTIKWERPSRWHHYPEAEVRSFFGRNATLRATPNHRMPVLGGKKHQTLLMREVAALNNHRLLTSGKFSEGTVNNKPAVRLLAAFQADGHRDAVGHVHWTFVKARKSARLEALLKELNLKYSRYELPNNRVRFYLAAGQGQNTWAKSANAELLSWSQEALEAFVDELQFWDGHVDKRGYVRITAKSREHLEWLQTACHLAGRSANIARHKVHYWVLSIRATQYVQWKSMKEAPLATREPVWCPTMPSGCFLIRQNGSILVSGNSGDVHTYVTRLVWPDMPWTGDLKQDKKIAKQLPEWDNIPGHDFRFQAKRVQHGPLHPSMEVLTPEGWRPAGSKPTQIAVWAPDGSILMEHVPWHEFERTELVWVNHQNMQQLVSPDHRIPHYNNGKLGERCAGEKPTYGRAPVTGTLKTGEAINPVLGQLWAASWADGHLEKHYPNSVTFHLKKERKKARLRALAHEAGLVLWENAAGDHFRLYGFHKKALSWAILGWSVAARKAFLAELPLRVFNTDFEGLSIIQAVAHTTGQSFAIRKHGKPKPNEIQCYFGTISNRQQIQYTKTMWSTHAYPEKHVLCPTTSTGWLLVRHNGVVSVTGNSNYGLTPFGIAMIAHIPVAAAAQAQKNYFRAFPYILAWQRTIRAAVEAQERLVNPLGIGTKLFGRPWDEHTYKQGLSYKPQGLVAHIINCAAWQLWNEMDPHDILMLAQVHDALVWQHRIEDRARVMTRAMELMSIPVPIEDIYGKIRIAQIETEAAVGANWGHWNPETNPVGVREWPFE